MPQENIFVVVLAAGKGTRIGAKDKPKAMFQIADTPMIGYFIELLKKVKPQRSIFVIGFRGQQIIDYLSRFDRYEFVWQRRQIGTGHALKQAEKLLGSHAGTTIVINADNPFFRVETLRRISAEMKKRHAVMAVSAVALPPEFGFGRLIIKPTGQVEKIIEVKNATPSQLKIRQMNAGLYAFDNQWLWENIGKIKKDKLFGEYYLTDIVKVANKNQNRVIAVPISTPKEAIGINTLLHLKEAENQTLTYN